MPAQKPAPDAKAQAAGATQTAGNTPPASTADQPATTPDTAAGKPTLPAGMTEPIPGVFRIGNSYGDSTEAAQWGAQPGGRTPSAQNVALLEAIINRGVAERAAERAAEARQSPRGFWPAPPQMAEADPNVMRERRMALSDAIRAARTPYPGSPNRQLTAKQLSVLAQLGEGGERDVLERDKTDANNAAALQREAMQQDGANTRTDWQEQGADRRAAASRAISLGELALRGQEFGLKQDAQMPQLRAAQRDEAWRQRYEAASPEQRSEMAKQRQELDRAFKGGSDEWSLHVTPTTKNMDGSTTEGNVLSINQKTGEIRRFATGNVPVDINSPAAQAIINDTSLSREDRAKKLRDLGVTN